MHRLVQNLGFALLAAMIAMPTSASAETFGEDRRYFKDWLAACRPTTGYCSATAYINPNPPSGIVADYVLRVGRNSGTDAWEISLSTVATMATDDSFVTIGEEPDFLFFQRTEDFVAFGAINDFFFLGNNARHLLHKMLADQTLNIELDTDQGRKELQFSLSGLTASLLWIDEQQDAVGSPRLAGYAPRDQQRAFALPNPPATVPQAIKDMHFGGDQCEFGPDHEFSDEWENMQLDQTRSLFMLPCSAGAYNYLFRFYVWDQAQQIASAQHFVDYNDSTGWTSTDMLVNPSLDRHSITISSFNKFRGLGDCGSSGTWQWAGYGLQLREYYYQPICGLDYDENADLSYPQIFPEAD
ncbi:DUF1176 domain-containing protein [Maritalea mediterranea]|uniref:DUF1176 domain-containing protein n=1 Tax=Maritalea mediterranea TaxID=2909667 RepID=A0ABS9EBB3_9HYPH|nr:DUF1176 domain-containing protein [Maritalea mediterranea]MCF4099045.1 DUF1176 domain-containing protein [Maritalea mediterranea]